MGTVAVSSFRFIGGASRDRTGDLLHAMQALSQLSYGPTAGKPASLGAVPGTVNHFFTFRTKPNASRVMPIHFSTTSAPFMIAEWPGNVQKNM